jgi:hypothetical protein
MTLAATESAASTARGPISLRMTDGRTPIPLGEDP